MIHLYDMYDSFRAVCRKLRVITWKDRIKLSAKLVLRLFGWKKCLFLGGYSRKEDKRQYEQDMQIYRELKSKNINGLTERCSKEHYTERMPSIQVKSQIRAVLQAQKSYIALVVQNLDKGGLEEVVGLLAFEFYREKIPVKILCIHHGGEIADSLRSSGIEVVIFNGQRSTFEQFCRENKPLIANTHYVLEYLDVFKELNVPVVEVIHNMYVFLNATSMAVEARKIPYINHYVAVSERAKEIFLRKFPEVSAQKVSVIGNALKGKKLPDKGKKEIRTSLGIEQDAFVFIVVGSIDARKNQIGILRAWDIVKRITEEPIYLVIAGGGTDYEYEYKVQRFVKERKLSSSVIFTGHRRDVGDLMYASDVLVLNSYYEGWSIAATEALLCGLPIIHADCGSGIELTAGGKNGILIDNPLKNIENYDSMVLYDVMHAGINENIEQLAIAMLNVLSNKECWKAKRKTIRQYAVDNFSTSMVQDKYLEIFMSVLKEDPQIVKEMENVDEQSRNRHNKL